jgi:hypothetical protein
MAGYLLADWSELQSVMKRWVEVSSMRSYYYSPPSIGFRCDGNLYSRDMKYVLGPAFDVLAHRLATQVEDATGRLCWIHFNLPSYHGPNPIPLEYGVVRPVVEDGNLTALDISRLSGDLERFETWRKQPEEARIWERVSVPSFAEVVASWKQTTEIQLDGDISWQVFCELLALCSRKGSVVLSLYETGKSDRWMAPDASIGYSFEVGPE